MEARQQVDRGAQVVDVAVQHGLVELVRIAGAPWAQMAGSLARAVPGSNPLQVMPSRTTLKPNRAISEASATERFHGLPLSG